MKQDLFKKYQPSTNTYDKLEHLQNKSYDRSDYNSLNKYNRSPYLQKVANQMIIKKKNSLGDGQGKEEVSLTAFKKRNETDSNAPQMRSFSNNSNYQLPKVNNITISPNKRVPAFRLPRLDQEDTPTFQKQTAQSATLQFSSTKKKRLQPLRHQAFKCVIKTKAGTNGKQVKINQDSAFVDQKLPFGLKCYCVCDGHGLNGHIVSSYIKNHMLSNCFINQRENLTSTLKKQTSQPDFDKMQQLIFNVFVKTNQSLLDSQINTELSGSTVVSVFQYKSKLFCFNVGDSRAILCYQVQNNISPKQSEEQKKPELQLVDSRTKQNSRLNKDTSSLMKIHLSKSHKLDKFTWKVHPLSSDQKPERPDQHDRILKNGGRIQCNRNEKGQQLGPLRVWMKDIQMPGLAMTRSFGDKAGLKAGTSAQPEVTQHDITPDDMFLVIASDGIWEYLENQEVMNVIVPFFLRDDIDMAAEKLVKISTEIWSRVSYSRDDITAIIVALNTAKQ